jgi:hypothetical protein
VNAHDVRAVVVGGALAELEPRLFQFMLHFARDNELQTTRAHDALASLHTMTPPSMAPTAGEPREPV